jgi:GNAT superfamily N-acetyltransferase
MSLDLGEVISNLQALAQRLRESTHDWRGRLERALRTMAEVEPSLLRKKANASRGRIAFLPAGVTEGLANRYTPPSLPQEFSILAVDGSHIDVDRHIPVRCYLINIGGCVLTYGSSPDAHLFSQPRLYAEDADLFLVDPASGVNAQPVEGPILGIKRTVEELKALAPLLERAPDTLPALALVDGSLILWGLAGQGHPPFVRQALIEQGLVPALDALLRARGERPLALAAYISLPRSTEVANALRLAFCPYDVADCQQNCGSVRPGERPCDVVQGLPDRELFSRLLKPGERSALFFTTSSVVRDHYRHHQVFFYYINVGEEVARVEVPEWATEEALLGLSHTLILDQCRRGRGYPAALVEAHEQAVVTAQDREEFRHLVEMALGEQRLPFYTSEKSRSKRVRWL